jgi:hypothetical protein
MSGGKKRLGFITIVNNNKTKAINAIRISLNMMRRLFWFEF